MKQRKNFSQGIIIALIVALALSGCAGQTHGHGHACLQPNSRRTPSPIINASGEVVPAQWTTLSFAQAGNVDELSVKEGDAIKAGDVIARLSAPELRSESGAEAGRRESGRSEPGAAHRSGARGRYSRRAGSRQLGAGACGAKPSRSAICSTTQ